MLFIKINKHGIIKNINKPDILTFIDKLKNVSHLHSWTFNTYEYKLYGSNNGNAGNENKYDLPPPIDNDLYFNDLYFFKIKNSVYFDLTLNDYYDFYNTLFQGFEDIYISDNEISQELSEHSSDRDFINDDDISISSNEYYEEEDLENTTDLNTTISDISITDTDEDIIVSNNYSSSQNIITNSSNNNELISSIEISISSSESDNENE